MTELSERSEQAKAWPMRMSVLLVLLAIGGVAHAANLIAARVGEHEADAAYHNALAVLHDANHTANPHVLSRYAGQVARDYQKALDGAHLAYENAPGTLIATHANIDAHSAGECVQGVDHDLRVAREQARFGAAYRR